MAAVDTDSDNSDINEGPDPDYDETDDVSETFDEDDDENSDYSEIEENEGEVDEFIKGLSEASIGDSSNDIVRKALMKICRDGLEDRLIILLRHGIDIDERDRRGKTGLMRACEAGHRSIVDLLIKEKANVDAIDNEGKTPLMAASQNGHEQVVELLLESVNDIDVLDENGFTALVFACEGGYGSIINTLIDKGADFLYKDKGPEYVSPMLTAIHNRHINIVRSLIARGCDVNERRGRGLTALIAAAQPGNEDIVNLLLDHGANIHAKLDNSQSAVTECWHTGDTTMLELLLKRGASVNDGVGQEETLLMGACRFEYEQVVDLLLKNGADVNARNKDEDTALVSLICCESEVPNIEIAKTLLQHNADVNAKCENGFTALMHACRRDLDTFAVLLLDAGASIDDQNDDERTAVMLAAGEGSTKCLEVLIDGGANVEIIDKDGCSILSCAMGMCGEENTEECLKILLDKGVLLSNGKLKPLHKNANYNDSNYEAVEASMSLGFFEWEFCSMPYSDKCLAALKWGYCPGKMKYYRFDDIKVSPLIAAFLDNDAEAVETYLKHRYYFPEDYKLLANHEALRSRIENVSLLDRFTLQPLSLYTWSFISISKAISLSGRHNSRSERVETLAIPDVLKGHLKFKIDL